MTKKARKVFDQWRVKLTKELDEHNEFLSDDFSHQVGVHLSTLDDARLELYHLACGIKS